MEQVIEMVSFALNEGVQEQDFVKAAKHSQTFISSLPGFLYRSLSFNATENTWTDIVYWQSMSHAKSAGEQFMESKECQPLIALINPESVLMQHQDIKMGCECQG